MKLHQSWEYDYLENFWAHVNITYLTYLYSQKVNNNAKELDDYLSTSHTAI